MTIHKAFNIMATAEQVDFFIHCQQLLVKFHPDSPFVCRRDNLNGRIHQMKNFVTNYKGLCYCDDNVCALYNRIVLTDPSDPVHTIRINMYREPDPNYNAIIIDFVVFRALKDCLNFVQSNYDPRIQHVLYVKNNKVKIYPVVQFISQIFNVPVV